MATKLMGLSLDELSFVDRPANKAARVSIFKRDGDDECEDYISVAKGELPDEVHEYLKREFSTSQREAAAEAGQALPGGGYPIKNTQDLKNAVQAIGRAKNPAATRRHIARRARALGATDQLPADWTKSLDGETMDHKEAIDALKAQVADLSAKLQGLTKESNDGEKANPPADGKGAGTPPTPAAASAQDTAAVTEKRITEAVEAEVAKRMKAASEDEIIKVIDPSDDKKTIELKKSVVGDSQFAMFKAQNAEIQKAKDAQELVELQKRADAEFGNLTGTAAEKAKVLKALNAMPEEVRKTCEAMLKSGNAALKKSMKSIGSDGEGGVDDPVAKLDLLAAEYAKTNKVSKAQGYDAILKTEEGSALYTASLKSTPRN